MNNALVDRGATDSGGATRLKLVDHEGAREFWKGWGEVGNEILIRRDSENVPLLGDALRQALPEREHPIRYIERWNTGILRMRRWMREHGLPEPVFEEIGQTFRVTFHGPGDDILDLIPEAGVTDLWTLGLNERQIEALRLMVNEGQEMTNREYRERFRVTHTTAHRDIRQLLELGWVRAVGQGRGRKYVANTVSM